ncbi:MAG: tetratricopeptide repeat protein [Methylocella sp.]
MAKEEFNDAIRILPDFVAADTGRGLLYENIGNWATAKEDFEKALSLSPDFDAGLARRARKEAKAELAKQTELAKKAELAKLVPDDIRILLDHYLYHGVPKYSQRPQTSQYKSMGNARLSEWQFFFLTELKLAGDTKQQKWERMFVDGRFR